MFLVVSIEERESESDRYEPECPMSDQYSWSPEEIEIDDIKIVKMGHTDSPARIG